MSELLFEIGTEEIPARFMPGALADLKQYAEEELSGAHIPHGTVKAECTPRRLVLTVGGVAERQEDAVELSKGPLKSQAYDAEGNPTKAAQGFARSRGVEVADLKTEIIGGAEYIVAEKRTAGQPTADVLPRLLEKIMQRLSFPKSMYWAEKNVRFARPVRWLLALYGDRPLDVTFGSVKSGTTSRGHRFMGKPEIEIKDAASYAAAMRENRVITDPEERKSMILAGIAEIEKELGAKVTVDPELLEENVHLNEYPIPFYGSFDKEFLDIPAEVLILSMAKNQRYFPVHDAEGRLMANFIGVSNNRAADMNVVREGNERVLRARLYDAAFFWKEDQQKSLDARAEELKNVTYQEQLGSVYDKVQRIKKITLRLADELGAELDRACLARACDLAKADLVTNMVYEFSDVQGVMGREYARKAGEPEEVALALYEQYLPRFAGDKLPSRLGGALLGIGERLDTLSAIYKIGLEPTSSQDPYGLRRAARTINELIWGLSLDIDMDRALEMAASQLEMPAERLEKMKSFIAQRQQVQLREKGFAHEAVALAMQTIPARPLQIYRLAEVLTGASGEAWFAELVTAAVRVKNLLAKAGETSSAVDPAIFTSEAEKKLYEELAKLTVEARSAVDECRWEKLAATMSELAPVIAQFFNDVLVMDSDMAVRANRLALLSECQKFFMRIGDFSLLK
ncbi:MAG: glycine--tRNA ligase subunit beta [Synergistaceae bacterium]|nr:glycine--tRNA ligase subunit beta [Synergistaceae bacterium]